MKRLVLVLFCLALFGFSSAIAANSQPVDVNTASVSELMALKGIGKTYAERIVAYRATNGPFVELADLKKVKGIGNKTLEKLESQIVLGQEEPEIPVQE